MFPLLSPLAVPLLVPKARLSFQLYLVLTDRNSYPPRMLPGIDIMVCTSATNDKDARLLLSAMGVPFHGKHVN